MAEHYQITLDVEVWDKTALRAAAATHALKFMSAEDWEDLRATNFSDVAADLHMLLDPGAPPNGCSIENGEVTYAGKEDQDA